jgi:hypothetical protein
MPTEPAPLTLSKLVHRAVTIVDPDGADDDLVLLMERFEDEDVPVSAILDGLEQRLSEEAGTLDPQEDSAPLQIAVSLAVYLGFRRDEFDDDAAELLRRAARAEYDGHPPANVATWLDQVGISY